MSSITKERVSLWRRLASDPTWLSSIGAVLIGVSALSVSAYQASIMREQQRMSVWPHVALWNSNVDPSGKSSYYEIALQNEGVGPARLQSVEVLVDGQSVGSWGEALVKLKPKDAQGQAGEIWTSTLNNRVLPAGNKAIGLHLQNGWQAEVLDKERSRVRIRFCYCSIYNECTLVDEGKDVEQQAVEACPTPDLPFEN